MNTFKDMFVRDAYYKIRDQKVSDAAIIKALELYIKRKLSPEQAVLAKHYCDRIRSGELSFEQYWEAYNIKMRKYRKGIFE